MLPLHTEVKPIWENGPLNKDDRVFFLIEAADSFEWIPSKNGVRFKLYGRFFKSHLRVEIANKYLKLEQEPDLEEDNFFGKYSELIAQIEFVSEKIIRFQYAINEVNLNKSSPMLSNEFLDLLVNNYSANSAEILKNANKKLSDDEVVLDSKEYKIIIKGYPFQITVINKLKNLTIIETPILKLQWVENGYGFTSGFLISKQSKYSEISFFSLKIESGEEHFYGCGEDYGRLDKREKQVYLDTSDTTTTDAPRMYKPIPFFMSTRGYGVFVHDSVPMLFDFGASFYPYLTIQTLEDSLDMFWILGNSMKEILSEYTYITGRAEQLPPQWSFGLWMSRISYRSENEVREVMKLMREHKIPCDVIHIDTDWFENEWECDFKWAPSKFPNPDKMISDAHKNGYKISLWQLPYIHVNIDLYQEGLKKGYFAIKPNDEEIQAGIIDVSNPDAVKWYQKLLRNLLRQGVDVIKVDFGESAYAEYGYNMDGKKLHNLYPLLYNKLQFELSKEEKDVPIIWARSAWAGSQRYPLHWAGDSKATFPSMYTTMRGGLSFGLSGFTFWSHDMGGFTPRPDEELYQRWTQFGFFTSHSRCHGMPPREPWTFSTELEKNFRKYDNMKYQLFPWLYTQSYISMTNGWPLLRTILFEFEKTNDPVLPLIEDQYMFGTDLMVAPVFKRKQTKRDIYFPDGYWYPLEEIFYYKENTISEYPSDSVEKYHVNENDEDIIVVKEIVEFKRYIGRKKHLVNAPLERIPVYIKDKSAILIGPLMQYHQQPVGPVKVSKLHLFAEKNKEIDSNYSFDFSFYSNNELIKYKLTISLIDSDKKIASLKSVPALPAGIEIYLHK